MPHQTKPLGERLRAAGSITLVGYAAAQVLRLVSNIILARLLFPEAFGTMAILQTVLLGVTMLTDVGLSMSLIRSRNGDDPQFLNTIWTLQILKGLLVLVLLVVIANPVAHFYNNESLAPMLAVIGLVALIGSLKSTKIDTATRNLQAKRITVIELASQALTLLTTACLAWLLKSPWALLLGNVFYALCRTVLSHTSLPGVPNRLAWSQSTLKEIMGFSSWVLLGSTVTFFAGEGLNLLRAKLVTIEFMGQLSIAASLAGLSGIIVQKITSQILFPAYAETIRLHPEKLAERVKRGRRLMLAFVWSISVILVFFAPYIVNLLYDSRYKQAALLIQISSVGMVITILYTAYSGLLDALGKPQLSTLLVACEGGVRIGGIAIGAYYFGEVGVVIGGVAVMPLIYLVSLLIFSQFKIKDIVADLSGMVLACLLALWLIFS